MVLCVLQERFLLGRLKCSDSEKDRSRKGK